MPDSVIDVVESKVVICAVFGLIASVGCTDDSTRQNANDTAPSSDGAETDTVSASDAADSGRSSDTARDTGIDTCEATEIPESSRDRLYARRTSPARISNDGTLAEFDDRWLEFGDRAGESDNRLSVSALWTAESLHLGFDIEDPSVETPSSNERWNRDSLEVAWAPDPSGTQTRSDRAKKWIVTADGEIKFDRTRDGKWDRVPTPDATRKSVERTNDGYRVELTLPWSAGSISPTTRDELTICIRNNVLDEGTVERLGCRSEAGSFADPSTWDTLALIDGTSGCAGDTTLDGGTDTRSTDDADTTSDAGSEGSNVCGDAADVPTNPDFVVDPSDGDTLKGTVERASDGDTILLEDGTDSEAGVRIHDLANLTVVVDRGATYVLDGRDYDPADNVIGALSLDGTDGVTVDGTPGQFVIERPHSFGITVTSSTDYTIRGVTVRETAYDGIWLRHGAQNGLFERVRSFGANGFEIDQPGLTDGFVIYGSDPVPTNNTFRCTIAHHNTDDGFDAILGSDTTIEHSLVWANGYNLDGRNSPAPGAGFKLSYDEQYYQDVDGDVPTGNTVRKSLSFHNGGCGVTFGDGGMTTHRVTAWANARKPRDEVQNNNCRPGGNPGDIVNWDADSGHIESSVAEYIEQTGTITYQNNLTKPPSSWEMDREVAGDFSPKRPESFGVPEPGSDIADEGVGAADPGSGWIEEVLTEAGR